MTVFLDYKGFGTGTATHASNPSTWELGAGGSGLYHPDFDHFIGCALPKNNNWRLRLLTFALLHVQKEG